MKDYKYKRRYFDILITKRSFLLCLIIILLSIQAKSQQISVEEFTLDRQSMDARLNNDIRDANGKECALIKVQTTIKSLHFEGDMSGIAKRIDKIAEYWVLFQGVQNI